MKLTDKKVLITGGAGFIGSHICDRLANDGIEITVFDNFSTGNMENLKAVKDKISIIKGDIQNYKEICNAIRGHDIVIHEAFPYGVATRSLEKQFTEEGALGTFNVLRASVEQNVKKVVYASTVAVYGIQKYIPIDEDHPKNPFLPYGATKYVGELYCSTFANVYGLDTLSLRYFNCYGPRYAAFDHSAMIQFLKQVIDGKPPLIYGNGTQMRDYTFIDDVVEGTLLAVKKEKTYGSVFNIGGGQGIEIMKLAKKIIEVAEKNLEPEFAKLGEYRYIEKGLPYGVTKKEGDIYIDDRNYVADITKAKKILKYNPKTKIEDGIKKTMQWLKTKKNSG